MSLGQRDFPPLQLLLQSELLRLEQRVHLLDLVLELARAEEDTRRSADARTEHGRGIVGEKASGRNTQSVRPGPVGDARVG